MTIDEATEAMNARWTKELDRRETEKTVSILRGQRTNAKQHLLYKPQGEQVMEREEIEETEEMEYEEAEEIMDRWVDFLVRYIALESPQELKISKRIQLLEAYAKIKNG